MGTQGAAEAAAVAEVRAALGAELTAAALDTDFDVLRWLRDNKLAVPDVPFPSPPHPSPGIPFV